MIPNLNKYKNLNLFREKCRILSVLQNFVIGSFIIFLWASKETSASNSAVPPVEGVVLHTDRDIYITGEYLHFKAYLLSNQSKPQLKSKILYVLLQHESGIVSSSVLMLENNMADGYFYIHDTLPGGFYEITGYTNWMRNQEEKTFFRKGLVVVNRFDQTLSFADKKSPASSDLQNGASDSSKTLIQDTGGHFSKDPVRIDAPTLTGRRERVEVEVHLAPELQGAATLSVAVVSNNTLMQGLRKANIYNDYITTLENDFAAPHYFFMENGKYILSGKVTDEGDPREGVSVILNTPHHSLNMLYARTDQDGVFRLLLPHSYSARELYLTLDPATATSRSAITIFEKTDPGLNPGKIQYNESLPDNHRIRQLQDIVKANIAFEISHMEELETVDPQAKEFPVLYSETEFVFDLSEYIPFDDLQDIAREIIPALRIRGSKDDGFRAMLSCATTNTLIQGSPVFFIDGIISYDINPLMYLNSDLVERLEIHNRHWVHGELVFPGVVALFSNSNEYLKIVPELPVKRTQFDLMQKKRRFAPPSHTSPLRDRANPDLRHVLLWEPSLEVMGSETISFYTSDLPGDYTIHITGVLPGGEVISQQKSFEIK